VALEIKILIGDDEAGMRMILRKAIEKTEGFEIVGEGEDGLSVLSLAEKSKPDVIFLDVEMPAMNGIECAKKIIDINPKTIIIFATAHSEYMSDAFQLYAFDYLVKPFKMERVYQTLDRIKTLHLKNYMEEEPIHKIIRHEKGPHKLLIRNKEGISFIDTSEIIIVQREDRSTVIYTTDSSVATSEGLSEIEERLDKSEFLRTHKSYIINLSMISKIYPYGRWTYIIKLKNTDKDALLTHEKYEELKKIFEP
jgi:two-component system, LytTR family, response regulator